jgi:hypothetical protein
MDRPAENQDPLSRLPTRLHGAPVFRGVVISAGSYRRMGPSPRSPARPRKPSMSAPA